MPQKLFQSPLCPSEKVTESQLATDRAVLELDQVIHAPSRRSFFSTLSAFAAATAGAGLLAGAAPKAHAQNTAPGNDTILQVLNFALNFEYLESILYTNVTGSAPLSPGLGAGAPVTGLPGKLNLDPVTLATFENLVSDEPKHVTLLRAVIFQLGGTPISQPELDYTAGGTMSITTQAQLLAVTRQFTAVGTSAYAGGAALLVGNPFVLTGASQILGAESQHLGSLNALCNFQGVTSPQIDTLDYPPSSPNQFFTLTPTTNPLTTDPTKAPALGPIRTPQQVLGVVYGVTKPTTSPTPQAGITKGGFFPQGVNGAIHST